MLTLLLPGGRVCMGDIEPGLPGSLSGVPAEGPTQKVYNRSDTGGYSVHWKQPMAEPTEEQKWFYANSVIRYEYKGEIGYYPLSQVDILNPIAFCGHCGDPTHAWRLEGDYLCIHCRLDSDSTL